MEETVIQAEAKHHGSVAPAWGYILRPGLSWHTGFLSLKLFN